MTPGCYDTLEILDSWIMCRLDAGHPDEHEAEGVEDELDDTSRVWAIAWTSRPTIVAGEVVTVSPPSDTLSG